MYHPDRGVNSALKNPLPEPSRWYLPLVYGIAGLCAAPSNRLRLGVFHLFPHFVGDQGDFCRSSHYDLMIRRMQEPDFKLGEIALYGALLFHGLNGMRILLVDFVLVNTHRTKVLFWACCFLTVILLIAGAIPLILHTNVYPFFQDYLPGAE